MNIITQSPSERLRPLVGLNGWDYCVHWKLSQDQRFLGWMGCSCAGTEGSQNGGEELLFPVSSVAPCRDNVFPHSRTKSCDLLSQLPTSITLDSGIRAETLLSNQPNWVNYSNSFDPNTLEEAIGTQVLIPVPGGLVELFVTKQVPEDQQVIDFITAHCIMDMSFDIDVNSLSHMQPNMNPPLGDENDGNTIASETSSLPPHDQCNSPMNLMQQYSYSNPQNIMKSDAFFEDSQGSFLFDKSQQFVEPIEKKEQQGDDKDLIKHLVGRSDSMSDCSDQNEEEDDGKYRRRNGKGNQSKNLLAERRRRKKLNDSLYNLRSLVPRISKLDRASILGDAIEYVKDLQKQVKELQDELEEHSEMDEQQQPDNVVGVEVGPKADQMKTQNGFHRGKSGNGNVWKQKQEFDAPNDKQTQQMEAQVEVAVIEGKELYVKVFCEHRPGGFVKLMEAFYALGLEVIHATVTSNKCLVSNVFKVEYGVFGGGRRRRMKW
ncbi:transcription factor ABORTED MICROSPORES-like isoform X2 [Prosopis cineraria]|uniref:transcription factor ABORTED MICROSPORES-like isoform X2 n=1 Tax=Prosopis cineraria TaxID=364024 RepID=UPI00240FA480|nr:transcription factor ABORTED MICROSPORES-like isoform X2 [Prosopis cineraria]